MTQASRNPNILIVDDDPSTCRSLQKILEKEGYDSVIAGDGRRALELSRSKDFEIGLIDLRLPDIDGIELIQQLQNEQPDVSFILLTGYASMDTSIDALNIGASAYLTKPIDMDSLLTKIDRVIAEQNELHESEAEKRVLAAERDKAREYLDAAAVIMVMLDRQGNIEYLNKYGRNLLGYSEEEILHQNWFELVIPKPESSKVKKVHKANIRGDIDEFVTYENSIVLADGSIRTIAWSNSTIRGDNDTIVGILSSGIDISEKKRTMDALSRSQEELKERIKELSALYRVTQLTSNYDLSIEQIFERVVSLIPDSFPHPNRTSVRISYGMKEWKSPSFHETDINLSASFHIVGHNRGKLEVFYISSQSDPDSLIFPKTGQDMINAIARNLELAVQQRLSQASLAESESLFRNIFEFSPIGIALFDDQGNFIRANDAFLRFFGNDNPSQYQGLNMLNDPAVPEKIKRRIRSGQSAHFETQFDFDRISKTIETKKRGISFGQVGISPIHYGSQGKLMGYIVQIVDVTERTHIREELREERDRAELYLDLSDVIFVALDREGKVTMINKTGCEVLGCSTDDIEGCDWIGEFIPHEERDDVRTIFNDIIHGRDEEHHVVEGNVLTRYGNIRLIKWYNVPLKNEDGEIIGTLSSGKDITEQRRAERDLRNSQERFALFADRLPGQMYIKDNDMKFIYVNRHMVDRFGADDWIGRTPEQCYPSEIAGSIVQSDKRVLKEGEIEVIEKLVDLEGSSRIFKTLKFPIERNDNPTLIGGLGVDITELQEVQQELETERDRAFFYLDLMGHDIRNKLQAIVMSIEVLEQENLDSAEKSILNTAMIAAEKCGKLIKDVKETEDLAVIPLETMDLIEVFNETIDEFSDAHPDVIIETRVHCKQAQIEADRHIRTVLDTLLSNAIEHNTSAEKRIWAQLEADNQHYELSIADNGKGIPEDRMKTLFDMNRRYGGVGLLQAKQIVQKYDGDISVRNRIPKERNKGALFEVELPNSEHKLNPGETKESTYSEETNHE